MPASAPVGVPHPLVDESAPGWAASSTAAPIVSLNSGRSALIVDCVNAGVRPILVTRPDARLTFPLFQTLRVAGGVWLTRDDDGVLRHGGSGERVAELADAVGPAVTHSDAVDHPPVVERRAAASDRAWIQLSVSVHHAAREETSIGAVLERMLDGLGAAGALSWGSAEPSTLAWDRPAISGLARGRMHADTRVIVAASGERRASGVIRVSRSDTGVIEETRLVAVVPNAVASSPEPTASLLGGLADRHQVLIGTAWSMRGPADATIPARSPVIPQPIAAVIGARGVRSLGLDAELWEQRHRARRVGNRRAPSLLLDFGGDTTGWRSFADAVSAIGEERMLSALLPAEVRDAA